MKQNYNVVMNIIYFINKLIPLFNSKFSFVGKVNAKQVREIAENKMKDLNAANIEGAIKMVEGSARSMGIEVTE